MEFVDYLLIFIILNLVILFVYQNIESLCPDNGIFADICRPIVQSKLASAQKELMQNVGNLAPSQAQAAAQFAGGVGCSTLEFPGINQCRLAGNMGPKTGFHQAFKPFLPEMGWRNFYLRFFGNTDKVEQLKADKLRTAAGNGFNNTVIRNFLDNMPSTDNIYRYTDY
jgi:hypothetical protein